jgi:ACR3 family arsenite efflux pump ArsB
MLIHRTLGFLPFHLCLPAFPITIFLCCSFQISHIVAQQFSLNFLTSPDGNLTNINPCNSSFQTIVAYVPADLIIFPFVIGVNSRLNIFTHSGISFNCFLFHALISDFAPQVTTSQTEIHFHANTYLFSPSA